MFIIRMTRALKIFTAHGEAHFPTVGKLEKSIGNISEAIFPGPTDKCSKYFLRFLVSSDSCLPVTKNFKFY